MMNTVWQKYIDQMTPSELERSIRNLRMQERRLRGEGQSRMAAILGYHATVLSWSAKGQALDLAGLAD